MQLRALSLSFAQLPDPAFRGVLVKALGLTVLLFAGLVWLELWLFERYFQAQIEALAAQAGWLAWLAEALAALLLVALLVVLFPMFATMLISAFLDDIAAAVERRHYPADSPGRELPLAKALGVSARFLVLSLALNLASLPLHLIGLFFPVINLLIFYGLNGYLVSREYFSLVSLRHLGPNDAERVRRAHAFRVFATGALIIFLMTVPLVNLLAPIVGAAMMTHTFKGLTRETSRVF